MMLVINVKYISNVKNPNLDQLCFALAKHFNEIVLSFFINNSEHKQLA